MSKPHDDREWELGLRDGLRRLSAPTPSTDFDAGVFAALQRPWPWWQTIWQEARPLLAGAACSCAVMAAALSWSLQTPSSPHPTPSATALHAARSLDMAAVDHMLDRPDLSAASLVEIAAPDTPAPRVDSARRPPSSKRRVSGLPAPVLV